MTLARGESISIRPQPERISITPVGDDTFTPSTEVLDQRAAKYHFGLGADSPGIEQISAFQNTGHIEELRRIQANLEAMRLRDEKLAVLQEYIRQRGEGEVDLEEAQMIMSLTEQEMADPTTILERRYAQQVVNQTTVGTEENATFTAALEEDPDGTLDVLALAQDAIANKEVAQRVVEELEAERSQRGVVNQAWDFAEQLIPFITNKNIMNEVEGVPEHPLLPGANLRAQVEYLLLQPPAEFERLFTQTVNSIKRRNLLSAIQFANAVLQYSTRTEFLDNIFGVLDVVDVGGTATAFGVSRFLARQRAAENLLQTGGNTPPVSITGTPTPSTPGAVDALADAMKDVIASTGARTTRAADVLEAAGDVEAAARLEILRTAAETVKGRRTLAQEMRVIEESAPSIFNPRSISTNTAGTVRRELVERALRNVERQAGELLEVFKGSNPIARMSPKALDNAFNIAIAEAKRDFQVSGNNAVLDIRRVEAENTLTDTNQFTMVLGRPNGTLFETKAGATNSALSVYKLPQGSFDIVKQGHKYKIEVTRDVGERADEVRSGLLLEPDTKTPVPPGPFRTWIHALRNPDDALSKLNRDSRKAATYGPQAFQRVVQQVAKSIGKLKNNELKRMQRLWEMNRDYVDPTKSQRGIFYRSVGAFESEYQKLFGNLPSAREVQAYFSYVQLNDLDWAIRNFAAYRDKAILGTRKTRFMRPTPEGMQWTENFDAVRRNDIPWNTAQKDFNIYMLDDDTGKMTVKNSKFFSQDQRNNIDLLLSEKGYKVYQPFSLNDPVVRSITTEGGKFNTVHFMVVKNAEERMIDLMQVPYRAGGHVGFAEKFALKQAKINKPGGGFANSYSGDNYVRLMNTASEAGQFAKLYDEARQLLKSGNMPALARFLRNELHDLHTVKDFQDMFDPLLPNALDLDEPIEWSPVNQSLWNHNKIEDRYPGLRNNIDDEFNLSRNVNRMFTETPDVSDVQTIKISGTANNPKYNLEPPRYIDPLSMIDRSISKMGRSRWLEDYKHQSVSHWIEEFGDLLDVPKTELRNNPFVYFANPPWKSKIFQQNRLAAAKTSLAHIQNLQGIPTDIRKLQNWGKEHLLNFVYNKLGQNAAIWIDDHLLPTLTDPTRYMRNVAFHSKLGLGNWIQFFLQAQTLTHTFALTGNPIRGIQGTYGGILMQMMRHTDNPSVIDAFANAATKFHWDKSEFLESFHAMRRAGLDMVEGEVAVLDDITDPTIFKSTVGNILDKGALFFKGGERLTRLSAWNVAYKEWRQANKFATLTQRDINKILDRVSTMTVNMTRDSNARWQRGFLSVPTQFFSYQTRLWEQMMGKRLTWPEKFRVLSYYSLMYGMPVASGSFTLYPFYEDIREYALNHNIPMDDNVMEWFMEGLPTQMIEFMFGQDTDFYDRFGPAGIQTLKDMFYREVGPIELLLGASGSIGADILGNAVPALKSLTSLFSEEQAAKTLAIHDFINVAREITTVDTIGKVYMMLTTQRFITENQLYMDDVDNNDALLAAFGLTPQEIDDQYLMIESMAELRAWQSGPRTQAIKYLRQSFQAGWDEDYELAKAFQRRAQAALQMGRFDIDQQAAILREALDGYQSKVEQTREEFWRSAPDGEQNARLDYLSGNTQQ